jgi:glycosidase
MDTYPYSYKDFMMKWMERVRLEYPDFSVVGETWLQKEAHTAFWQDRSPVSGNYSSNLDMVTDFPLYYALKDAFMQEEGWTSGLARIYYVLSQDIVYADPFSNVIFADNHDLTRFFTSVGEDINKYRMAMAILLTTRGIPMIYYGTELQMTGEEHKGHGYIREDFPLGRWPAAVSGQRSAVSDKDKVIGGDKEMEFRALAGRTQYLMKLLNWRKGSEVIHSGKLKHFVPQDGIYVYFRYTDREAVMVVVNRNKEVKTLEPARFEEMLKGYGFGKDVISESKFDLDKGIAVPAETALILELD